MKGIIDKDYEHAKRIWEDFKLKNLGLYHDISVQSDTLLVADLFETVHNKCIETYGLDPAHLPSAPDLAW